MKTFIFIASILISPKNFAQFEELEPYKDGRTYCKDIQKKESGNWIKVPKDYSSKDGSKIELYHWYLGKKFDSNKPTVVHIEGGPGGTSHKYPSWMDKISATHNILFFDQRGYVCSRPENEKDQADSRFYSTENTARDMEELRKSLGIKQWIVHGHSFGTPIGMKYAELFPSSLTSLLLSGPASLSPDKVEHYQAYKKRLLAEAKKHIASDAESCLSSQSEEFEENLLVLASVSGRAGMQSYIRLINKDKKIPSTDRVDQLISEEYSKFTPGKFSFNDYIYEERNTEMLIENEFHCSDLIAGCDPSSEKYKKTFDAKRLTIKTPTYFFLGEYDGTPVEQIQEIKNSMTSPATLLEIKSAGHGSFQDIFDFGDAKATQSMLKILYKALNGEAIQSADLKSDSANVYSLKLH